MRNQRNGNKDKKKEKDKDKKNKAKMCSLGHIAMLKPNNLEQEKNKFFELEGKYNPIFTY